MGVCVLQENDNNTNAEFQRLFHGLNKVAYKGQKKAMEGVSVAALLPETHNYITYQGSLTAPPCSEGITWILYNRPINIPKWHIRNLRNKIYRNKEQSEKSDKPMMGNTRPIQGARHNIQYIWTNVRSRVEDGKGPVCASDTAPPSAMKYSSNTPIHPSILHNTVTYLGFANMCFFPAKKTFLTFKTFKT